MNCPKCGKYISEKEAFCPSCGAYADPTDPNPRESKGLGIASLILGILSFFLFPYAAGILAVTMGALAKQEGDRSGYSTAGILCGILGAAFALFLRIL